MASTSLAGYHPVMAENPYESKTEQPVEPSATSKHKTWLQRYWGWLWLASLLLPFPAFVLAMAMYLSTQLDLPIRPPLLTVAVFLVMHAVGILGLAVAVRHSQESLARKLALFVATVLLGYPLATTTLWAFIFFWAWRYQ